MTQKSWRDLLGLAQRQLRQICQTGNQHDATHEAKYFLEEISGLAFGELEWQSRAPESAEVKLEELLGRRLGGEPLQYVLGRWGFRCLDLLVDSRVLIPRPETEVVVEVACQELNRLRQTRPVSHGPVSHGPVFRSPVVLSALQVPASQTPRLLAADLGCGSGAIGLSLAAENSDVDVVCSDISKDALAVTRANLAGLGMSASGVQILEGSWYEALPSQYRGQLDLVVSNPPYVSAKEKLPSEITDHEPAEALFAGEEGLDAIRILVGEATDWLAPNGAFVCEIAPVQSQAVRELAENAGLSDIQILKDLTGRDRVLNARFNPSKSSPVKSNPVKSGPVESNPSKSGPAKSSPVLHAPQANGTAE